VPVRLGAEEGEAEDAPLPPAPELGSEALEAKRRDVARLRRAMEQLREKEAGAALELLDALAEQGSGALSPSRLDWARALAHWELGAHPEALARIEPLTAEDVPVDLCAHALVAEAELRDALGEREEALAAYRRAGDHLAELEEQFAGAALFRALAERVAAGLEAPRSAGPEGLPALQYVPH
jgi:tetratricopeptide (TPR) repeat protein